jgi:protocatechuate 3,4-dioxygenase beta subunit
VVMDESGAPLQGVNVHRSVWTKERFPPNADYTTNEKGEVVFGVPHQVSIFRLWASKENYVPMFANFDARDLKGDPVPVEYTFVLGKGTTIGGLIHDEVGAPIAGANVEVSVSSRGGKSGVAVVSNWLAMGSDCSVTDKQGHWSLHNMPPGDQWEVRIKLGHSKLVSDLRERHPQLKELRDQTAILVMENGVQVRGTIKDPNGQPVDGAMVVWGDRPYHNELWTCNCTKAQRLSFSSSTSTKNRFLASPSASPAGGT